MAALMFILSLRCVWINKNKQKIKIKKAERVTYFFYYYLLLSKNMCVCHGIGL